MNLLLLIIITPFVIIISAVTYLFFATFGLPRNNPKAFLKHYKHSNLSNKPILICFGDTLTHGKFSSDYVTRLQTLLSDSYTVVNAGMNGETSWNLLQRIDELKELNPTVIVILTGILDAHATLSEDLQNQYTTRNSLPQNPSLELFEQHLNDMIRKMKHRNQNIRIIVVSPPPIGENNPDHPLISHSSAFADSCEKIAARRNVEYLNFHQIALESLDQPSEPKYHIKSNERQMAKNAIKHYWFRKSWDSIGEKLGFQLHTDFLNLNDTAAALLAKEICQVILNQIPSS